MHKNININITGTVRIMCQTNNATIKHNDMSPYF